MTVLMVLLVLLAPMVALYLAAGSAVRRHPPARAAGPDLPPAGPDLPPIPVDPPTLTLTADGFAAGQEEATLVRRLLDGAVDRAAYRQDMARLAAGEDAVRPLRLTGDQAKWWPRGGGHDAEQ